MAKEVYTVMETEVIITTAALIKAGDVERVEYCYMPYEETGLNVFEGSFVDDLQMHHVGDKLKVSMTFER